jgi:hypothetical protein
LKGSTLRNFSAINNNWLRKRWLDFRNGHGIYLVFIMTFANFVTIQYRLFLEKVPFLHSLFSNIWVFAILFVAIYIPLGMIIGYWHRKNQFSVEAEAMFNQNQIGATINLFIIDLIDGKVTEQEKQQMRGYLLKIMKQAAAADMPYKNVNERTSEPYLNQGLNKP